jgi:hypothetical protein
LNFIFVTFGRQYQTNQTAQWSLKRFQSEWDLLDKTTDDFNLYEWPSKSSALYFFAAEVLE